MRTCRCALVGRRRAFRLAKKWRQKFSLFARATPLRLTQPSRSIPSRPRSVRDRDHWEGRMLRLPQVDSACRFTGAILLGLAISCGGALAEDLTPREDQGGDRRRSTAPSSKATPRARTTGRPSASTMPRRVSRKLNQITSDNVKGLGLVWSYNLEFLARRRGDAGRGRRHHVPDRVMERGACDRRAHRKEDLDLRSRRQPRAGLQGLLRRRQSRRRALEGQGVRRRL